MNIDTDPTPAQGTQRPRLVLNSKIRSLIRVLRYWHDVCMGDFTPATLELAWQHFSEYASELGNHNVLVKFSAAGELHLIDYETGAELR